MNIERHLEIKLHVREQYLPLLSNDSTFSVQETSTNYKSKFNTSQHYKVKFLGKSQNGHGKWLLCIKGSYKITQSTYSIIHKIRYAEGIVFLNSNTLNAHTVYDVTILEKNRNKENVIERMEAYLDKTSSLSCGVYLFQMKSDIGDILKIGKSGNVLSRYSNSLTVSPDLLFLGYLSTEDYNHLEPVLHAKFQRYHYKREWFKYHLEILSYFETQPNWIPYN